MNEFIGSRAKVRPVNQTVDQTCVQHHICSEVACHRNSLFKNSCKTGFSCFHTSISALEGEKVPAH